MNNSTIWGSNDRHQRKSWKLLQKFDECFYSPPQHQHKQESRFSLGMTAAVTRIRAKNSRLRGKNKKRIVYKKKLNTRKTIEAIVQKIKQEKVVNLSTEEVPDAAYIVAEIMLLFSEKVYCCYDELTFSAKVLGPFRGYQRFGAPGLFSLTLRAPVDLKYRSSAPNTPIAPRSISIFHPAPRSKNLRRSTLQSF